MAEVRHASFDVVILDLGLPDGSGLDVLRTMRELRSPTHVIDAATAGSHIATMPLKVLDMLFNHPLTDKGLEQFLKDYAKVFQEAPVAR